MKKVFLIFVFILSSILVYSQEGVSFTASVSKEKLGINERFRITFKMNRDGDNFQPPAFDNFDVVMGPSQSVEQRWINGNKTFSRTYSYVLAPIRKGKFTIKPAEINIDGRTYKTNPINIEITEAVDEPSIDPTPQNIADNNVFLVAEVSNRNPYFNEPVMVTYKLYIGDGVGVSDYKTIKNPNYQGFWSYEIPLSRYDVNDCTYRNKRYRCIVMKQMVMYPQKTGRLEIEPMTAELVLQVATDRVDFFGRRLTTSVPKGINSGTQIINVKNLPEEGKPNNFSGAVGEFDFSVDLSKKELNQYESLTAKAVVKGKGNFKLFEMPSLNLPMALEAYEPEIQENLKTDIAGMRGNMSKNYAIIPQNKGKFSIPSVEFVYFNPKSKKYETKKSEEQYINVLPAPATAGPKIAYTPKNVLEEKQEFKFLKLKTNLKPIKEGDFFDSTLFYVLLSIPFLVVIGVVTTTKTRKKYQSNEELQKVRTANRLAKKYLTEAKKNIDNPDEFYTALERSLFNYIIAKMRIKKVDINKSVIKEYLEQKNINPQSIQKFMILLDTCELARYASQKQNSAKEDYEIARALLPELDKQL